MGDLLARAGQGSPTNGGDKSLDSEELRSISHEKAGAIVAGKCVLKEKAVSFREFAHCALQRAVHCYFTAVRAKFLNVVCPCRRERLRAYAHLTFCPIYPAQGAE